MFSGLPGVGPDGGRIVRALTWARTGNPARSGIDGEGAAVPQDRRDTMRLSEVATPLAQVVTTGPDEPSLPQLLDRLRIRPAIPPALHAAGHALVLSADGSAAGVLSPADFARARQLGALRTGRGKPAGL